jgi:hypothetical protein
MLAFRAMNPVHPAAWLPRTLLGLAALAVAASAAGATGSAAPVAADPAQFRYETLPADGALDFAIDAHSPTFEFQTGPSAYRAFRLPDGGPFYVDVRSFLEGSPHPARARVFYPVIAVLTDDFLVSRSTELELLRFDLPTQEGTVAPAYRVSLGVDPAHTRERYLVVFTPAQLLRGRQLPPIATPESAAEAAKVAFLGATMHGKLRISVRRSEAAPASAPEAR